MTPSKDNGDVSDRGTPDNHTEIIHESANKTSTAGQTRVVTPTINEKLLDKYSNPDKDRLQNKSEVPDADTTSTMPINTPSAVPDNDDNREMMDNSTRNTHEDGAGKPSVSNRHALKNKTTGAEEQITPCHEVVETDTTGTIPSETIPMLHNPSRKTDHHFDVTNNVTLTKHSDSEQDQDILKFPYNCFIIGGAIVLILLVVMVYLKCRKKTRADRSRSESEHAHGENGAVFL